MVCVGQIVGVHGVRGLVKLKSFTEDPAAIADYNPLMDQTGARTFTVELQSAMKDYWLAKVQGVADRDRRGSPSWPPPVCGSRPAAASRG